MTSETPYSSVASSIELASKGHTNNVNTSTKLRQQDAHAIWTTWWTTEISYMHQRCPHLLVDCAMSCLCRNHSACKQYCCHPARASPSCCPTKGPRFYRLSDHFHCTHLWMKSPRSWKQMIPPHIWPGVFKSTWRGASLGYLPVQLSLLDC